jgi:hypothetical protein
MLPALPRGVPTARDLQVSRNNFWAEQFKHFNLLPTLIADIYKYMKCSGSSKNCLAWTSEIFNLRDAELDDEEKGEPFDEETG